MKKITRICVQCETEYPATTEYFYISSTGKHGLKSICKECAKKYSRQWGREKYAMDAESLLQRNRDWRRANPERDRQFHRKWEEANPKMVKEKRRRLHVRRHEDLGYRLNNSMRSRMWDSLKGKKAGRSWESLIGYTLEDLIAHLESQFQRGMTWENYGEWHIDHIRPISDFKFTNTDDPDFRICWALENLQPLWADDNKRKGATLPQYWLVPE